MKKSILFIGIVLLLSSCDDLFTPANDNFKDVSQMYNERSFGSGLVLLAYDRIPGYYDDSDYATDDAVTNQRDNAYLNLAMGAWSATDNPFNRWSGYEPILHLNLFLDEVADKTQYYQDEEVNLLLRTRLKGEAYGLRAIHMYYLLRAHAGYTNDGKLMGVPIINQFQESNSDFNQPRATFEVCMQQIYSDLDMALENLPWEYNNVTNSADIPVRFKSITEDPGFYTRIMGNSSRQLLNGLIVQSFRSKVSLLAASPAFQDPANTTTWADAADHAAAVIDYAKGPSGLASNGVTFYANATEINGLSEGSNPPEIIWRRQLETGNSSSESTYFPPTLFGSGRMNPTQNLVDAFPMVNGYPITDDVNSGYDPSDPYTERDPRLANYIIYNGRPAGVSNTPIYTGSSSGTDNGLNILATSTRTGYYMKKRLRMDVNLTPGSVQGQTRYIPRIRYTEIFLNYAEAANEAWGPKGTGSHGYSAYDVIKAIRTRAGVGKANGDPYLEECATDPDKMRKLIQTERRLELCFESFRFWDLRRWKLNLNETTRGMDVNGNVYAPIDVEARAYQDYMYYGPIPHSEILKYSNLVQNKGW